MTIDNKDTHETWMKCNNAHFNRNEMIINSSEGTKGDSSFNIAWSECHQQFTAKQNVVITISISLQ